MVSEGVLWRSSFTLQSEMCVDWDRSYAKPFSFLLSIFPGSQQALVLTLQECWWSVWIGVTASPVRTTSNDCVRGRASMAPGLFSREMDVSKVWHTLFLTNLGWQTCLLQLTGRVPCFFFLCIYPSAIFLHALCSQRGR